MSKLEELRAKRAEMHAASAAARDAQMAVDLEAIMALEEKGGEPLHIMHAPMHKPGVVVSVGYRAATRSEYKRYLDTVAKAPERSRADATRRAQDVIAAACIVYPAEPEAREAYFEAFPGALVALVVQLHKLAELEAEDEGKK
jgi:hypothetical protein